MKLLFTIAIFLTSSVAQSMDENKFWSLIEAAKQQSKGQSEKFLLRMHEHLVALPPEDIIDFEVIFSKKIIDADHFNVMIPLKIMDGWVGDDSYLYFRCWLIAQGREIYENTIVNPDYLAEYVTKYTVPEMELLLYVSTKAFLEKTGLSEEDDTFPRSIAFQLGYSYDNHNLKTKGKDWTRKDLPLRAPKLWALFN